MQVKNMEVNNTKFTDAMIKYFSYTPEHICPICKSSIAPDKIYSLAYNCENELRVSILNYCTGCHSPFISTYKSNKTSSSSYFSEANFIGSEPNKFIERAFDEKMQNLSPQFCKIYNQALAAESSSLDEIAGLGYRKALEFLVKDFSIHECPEDEEKIKKLPLSLCVKNYIKNETISTLAERSVWIGNDEAHYIRKQEDRDVSDMKDFIQATVYFIGMILIAEDAASMDSAK